MPYFPAPGATLGANTFTGQQKFTQGTALADASGGNSTSATINKQVGNVSVTNQNSIGSIEFHLAYTNSLIVAGSYIEATLGSAVPFTDNKTIRIGTPGAGSVDIFILTAGNWSDDFNITITIFNP